MNGAVYSLPRFAIAGTAIFCLLLIVKDVDIQIDIFEEVPTSSFLQYDRTDGNEKRTFKYLEIEKAKAVRHLNDIDSVIEENSDPLPSRSNNLTASELCRNTTEKSCTPKFWAMETRIRVSPSHKMVNCIVQKSMSTVMTAIMCFLYDVKAFREANRGFFMEWSEYRLCKDKNELHSVLEARNEFNISKNSPGWSFSMVTREPVERFISGYVDKCIRKPIGDAPCNGCRRNMTCFIITEYDRMQQQIAARRLPRTFEDRHFFPQNWRCDLRREYKHYEFIRYSSNPDEIFKKDLFAILRRQNVTEDSIQFLTEQLADGRTVHSTVDSPTRVYLEKRLRGSPFLMEYVVKMFYYDFILFKYKFPLGF